MALSSHLNPVVALFLSFGAPACGPSGDAQPEKSSSAPSSPRPSAADENLPATKRILGSWLMRLGAVPDSALTDEFKKMKSEGLADKMRIEYTFTESELILNKSGAGGSVNQRWFYEVVSQNGDRLLLQRLNDQGQAQRIGVTVKGDMMIFGTGKGRIPLMRKK